MKSQSETFTMPVDESEATASAFRAIRGEVHRALIELITNADDSYRRLEANGQLTSGVIEILVERHHRNSIVLVRDYAEGISRDKLREQVFCYARASSGAVDGGPSRGFFGRGLKDAIAGLGSGTVNTVKDRLRTTVAMSTIDRKQSITIVGPTKVTANDEKDGKAGITKQGTEVQIKLGDDRRMPRFKNLLDDLNGHWALRDILTNPKRRVFLEVVKDITSGQVDERAKLSWTDPLGKLVGGRRNLSIRVDDEFVEAQLDIYVAEVDLDQKVAAGTAGILISDGAAIHDCTLFGFELDAAAKRIFGRFECKWLRNYILSFGQGLVSPGREGINTKDDRVGIAIQKVVRQELQPIIDDLRRNLVKSSRDDLSRRMSKESEKLLKYLNEAAFSELEVDQEASTGEANGGGALSTPKDGFQFIPEFYSVDSGRVKSLRLRAFFPQVLDEGSKILVSVLGNPGSIELVGSSEIRIDSKLVNGARDGVLTVPIPVRGGMVGEVAIVSAFCEGYEAVAEIKVMRKKQGPDEPPEKKRGGFISKIEFGELPRDVPYYLSRPNRVLTVNSEYPVMKQYSSETGLSHPSCTTLVAEFVTDCFCREILMKKLDTGMVALIGVQNPGNSFLSQFDSLKLKYHSTVHSMVATWSLE